MLNGKPYYIIYIITLFFITYIFKTNSYLEEKQIAVTVVSQSDDIIKLKKLGEFHDEDSVIRKAKVVSLYTLYNQSHGDETRQNLKVLSKDLPRTAQFMTSNFILFVIQQVLGSMCLVITIGLLVLSCIDFIILLFCRQNIFI